MTAPFRKGRRRSAGLGLTALLAITALLTGCTSAPSSPAPAHPATQIPSVAPTPPAPPAPPSAGTAAAVNSAKIAIYAAPDGAVTQTLTNPQPTGAPLVFLVAATKGPWLQVHLAQRPNGSTGWIKAAAVTLSNLDYSLKVSTEQRTLELFKNGTLVKTFSVATGTGGTPTPHGSFYLTELLAPTNTGYGPYAFGLSAFSDALSNFGGGPGQIGLHGTDDAASIGTAASHGCIRLSNPDITELAGLLPLATPITIG
jgi:lipoprotein-anchoring transpeptidase ErfK/SrfK